MVRYMNYRPTFNPGYTQEHIDRCAQIIDGFVAALDRMPSPADDGKILSEARNTVLSLNVLKQECNGSLIETDQREQICKLMLTAADYAGFTIEGDFTEEWREW